MERQSEADRKETPGVAFATDLDTLRKEVVVETYRAPGPGGQRKNKRETAVRLTHPPSGITVVASERRSQAMNRDIAFRRLQAKLARLNRPVKRRVKTKPSLSAVQKREEEKKKQSEKKRSRSLSDVAPELEEG